MPVAVHDIVTLFAAPVSMLPPPEKAGAALVTLNVFVWPPPARQRHVAVVGHRVDDVVDAAVGDGDGRRQGRAGCGDDGSGGRGLEDVRNDFAPATTATFTAAALVIVTRIWCVPGVGLARPHNSARTAVPLLITPREVMFDAGRLPHCRR